MLARCAAKASRQASISPLRPHRAGATSSRSFAARQRIVLGIETSCDDTAVAIVRDDRQVLARRVYADRSVQRRLGGICPATVAQQHRAFLEPLIEECLDEAGLRLLDVGAVAVTTRPGLVIALKAGATTALSLARSARSPLVRVHHMRAHALAAQLTEDEDTTRFPFLALLVSGGHSLLTLVRSPTDFALLASSSMGAGECLDKVGRELGVPPDLEGMHPGAAIEVMASRANSQGHLRYILPNPRSTGANWNFGGLREMYMMSLEKQKDQVGFSVEDFAASLQHQVARHLCSKLHMALEMVRRWEQLTEEGALPEEDPRRIEGRLSCLVLSGGVAANSCLRDTVGKVSAAHGLRVVCPPRHLCTDNAEMIAWTALLLLRENLRSEDVLEAEGLPFSPIYVKAREDIGRDDRHLLEDVSKTSTKIKGESLHGEGPLKIRDPKVFRRLAKGTV